jgi:hypothetical protein
LDDNDDEHVHVCRHVTQNGCGYDCGCDDDFTQTSVAPVVLDDLIWIVGGQRWKIREER